VKPKRIAILGSTGSIGRQALRVIAADPDLIACALAAGNNWQLLGQQARRHAVGIIAIADGASRRALSERVGPDVNVLSGNGAMVEMVRVSRPDVLLSGVVGSAGLAPTLAGIDCGATLAIANKETLVMAGAIVMAAARRAAVGVLPVDSEHSAIFQCLASGARGEVRRVVITASGGALRDWDASAADSATVEDALAHPTWRMGPKITIDSATLINKAMEVVEAHWLFDLPADRIEVVIHPESIVHSCVEFHDGSVIAQLGRPDMTTPISYALCYPHRRARDLAPLDLAATGKLTFTALDGRFARAVNLGYEVIRRGGVSGAVLNAANEAAVEAFLRGRISFGQIVPLVEDILYDGPRTDELTLEALASADRWARNEAARRIDPLGASADHASAQRRETGEE